MKKINTHHLPEVPWTSPKGHFSNASKSISEALGHDPQSNHPGQRHPFDVEISRIPPGKKNSPYHSHSAQWEFYHVIAGTGHVRHPDGTTEIEPGDAFMCPPNMPHQVSNTGDTDLIYYIIADNPIGESCHYPDSNKWLVRSPQRQLIRSESLDYFDGEE